MRIITSLLAGALLPAATIAQSVTIPLSFQPDGGVYTGRIDLGHDQKIDALIDSGSSNLIVVGDKQVCKNCKQQYTQGRYHDPNLKNNKDIYHIYYGSSAAKLYKESNNVAFTGQRGFKYDFSVITHGESISNILGVAYPDIASPNKNPLRPYFDALKKKQNLTDEFTLKLCGKRGGSEFILGQYVPKQKSLGTTAIIKKSYYNVDLTGMSAIDKQGKVTQFSKRPRVAILDSGTGGMIVVPDSERKAMTQYLLAHTDKSNQQLPDSFWQKNYCVPTQYVDMKALPTLQFSFRQYGSRNKSFTLNLPPEQYINEGGCGKGYVRYSIFGHPDYMNHPQPLHHKKALLANEPPDVIIGTPLFEAYAVTFHRGKDARVDFYSSKEVCHEN